MKPKLPDVCVDFDGVLCQNLPNWQGVDHFGPPIAGAKAFLESLRTKFRVVIFTCRCNPVLNKALSPANLRKKVRDWMVSHDLPFDEIYIGEGKPIASAYIDDKAVPCRPEEDSDAYKWALISVGIRPA